MIVSLHVSVKESLNIPSSRSRKERDSKISRRHLGLGALLFFHDAHSKTINRYLLNRQELNHLSNRASFGYLGSAPLRDQWRSTDRRIFDTVARDPIDF